MKCSSRFSRFALHGWIGVFLLATCWPLNWLLPGLRTAYLFFPLWLGYILTTDALVARRTRTSLWTRSRKEFALLFVASSPVWWLFEAINWRTRNWEYLGAENFTRFEYYALCTLCFSTVMPAVFETAELVRTFRWVNVIPSRGRVPDTRPVAYGWFCAGVITLVLTFLWPKYFYPFVWISLALIFEPMNRWLRRPHFLQWLKNGDWRPMISLSFGALICGFFWEMWNYWSWPKWIYHTPGAEFAHFFEMPLLGYGGYVPFALELFGLKNFLRPHGAELRL